MIKTRNPYRRSKHFQFIHEGRLLLSKYCTSERALKIAIELEKQNWYKIDSILITTHPNA